MACLKFSSQLEEEKKSSLIGTSSMLYQSAKARGSSLSPSLYSSEQCHLTDILADKVEIISTDLRDHHTFAVPRLKSSCKNTFWSEIIYQFLFTTYIYNNAEILF